MDKPNPFGQRTQFDFFKESFNVEYVLTNQNWIVRFSLVWTDHDAPQYMMTWNEFWEGFLPGIEEPLRTQIRESFAGMDLESLKARAKELAEMQAIADQDEASFMSEIPNLYELGEFKNVLRTAMKVREDSFEAGVGVLGRYGVTITQACEIACLQHGMEDFLPLIVAALNGGWNEMDQWVNGSES